MEKSPRKSSGKDKVDKNLFILRPINFRNL